MGLKRVYWNRTPSKAEELAEAFGGTVLPDLSDEAAVRAAVGGTGIPAVVISTIPQAAEFTLPDWMVAGGTDEGGPIVFDVNYKPFRTALLGQAEDAGLDVVRGSEMLWEQGVGQFELWTGRTAPYAVMKGVVLANCLPEEEEE